MPDHTTITNLGYIKARAITYDDTTADIVIPPVETSDTFVTEGLQQILLNKTLTTPVIASLKQASNGGTINMPTVSSGQTKTLATTSDLPTLPNNMATTDTAQTLESKTLTTPVIASLKQASNGGTINMPTVASGQTKTLATTTDIPTLPDNMATTNTAQTLESKTLTTPVIASLKQSSTGGTINMPTVANGSSATLATTTDIPSVSNMVTTDTVQNITAQKAFLAPVICGNGLAVAIGTGTTDELQFRVGNSRGDTCAFFERNATINGEETSFTLSVPTFSQNDVLAKVSELTALQNSVASATDFNTLKTIMTNLLSYLRDWIQVGNLTMNDVVVQSDPANYLHLRQADPS